MFKLFRAPTPIQVAQRRRRELQMSLISHTDSLKLAERNVAYCQQMLQELDTFLATGELEDWTPPTVPKVEPPKVEGKSSPTFLSTRLPKEVQAV